MFNCLKLWLIRLFSFYFCFYFSFASCSSANTIIYMNISVPIINKELIPVFSDMFLYNDIKQNVSEYIGIVDKYNIRKNDELSKKN